MKWEKIIGHRENVLALRQAVAAGRVGHAYLFAGPRGVGKTAVARAFAAALLCPAPAVGEACGRCRDCRQLAAGNHPELQEIRPDGASIKIDQVRELQRVAYLTPRQGSRRVFLVEEADLLTREAANSFLKVLEEPPERTVIILLSSRPQALPPTVLSRCQVFTFRPLPVREVEEVLVREAKLAPEVAGEVALLSGGSPGRALELARGDFAELRRRACGLPGMLRQSPVLEVFRQAALLAEDREKALTFLDLLEAWLRDLLVWRETSAERLLINRDRVSLVRQEAAAYRRRDLVGLLKQVGATKELLRANANTRLALEVLFLRLAGARAGREE